MMIEEEDYRLAKFCDALSNAIRLKLILLLRDEPIYVTGLAEDIQKDRTTTSRHLRTLHDHDLVQSETKGRRNIYSLKRPDLIEKFLELRPLLRR